MFSLCKEGKSIIHIRISGIDCKSPVEVLPCRIRAPVLDQVDGNQRHGNIIVGFVLHSTFIVFHGRLKVVLIAGHNVARHDKRPPIFRIPAQCIDKAVDGIFLIALL